MIDKEEYKLTFILNLFPKNKEKVPYNAIWSRVEKIFESQTELSTLLDTLRNLKLIIATLKEGYSITDKGLDILAGNETPEEYIIRKLNQYDGNFNFLHLAGNKFQSENEKVLTIQKLINKGYIKKVDGALGQTDMITDKYFTENINRYKHDALTLLKERTNQEVWWEHIVNILEIPKSYGEELKNLLEHEGYIYTSTRTKQGHAIKVLPKTTSYFYKQAKVHPHDEQLHVEAKPIIIEENPMPPEKNDDKGYYKIKQEIFWTALTAIVGCAFYAGTIKFDKDKIDLDGENRLLKEEKKVFLSKTSIDSLIIDSLHEKIDTLKKEYENALYATGILHMENDTLKKRLNKK